MREMSISVTVEVPDQVIDELARGLMRAVLEGVERKQAGPVKPVETGKLLTVKETSQALRMKPVTTRLWIARKKMPVVRMGRRVFVAREVVERMKRNGVRPRRRRVK
jgi:excisionase family DNA binding protein